MNKAQLRLVKSIEKARKYNAGNKCKKALAKFIKLKNRVIFSCDVGISAEIPTDCVFHHSGLGVVIGDGVKMGNRCQLYSNVVIGSKETHGNNGANPRIGNNVIMGAGSIILGGIVIGNNSIIAAGSVVLKDVPENAVVAGNPAEIKKIVKQV